MAVLRPCGTVTRALRGGILGRLGPICQKPERRALERDEERIEDWKRKRWPQVKKSATRLGAHLVFVDESGFMMIPPVRRTWHRSGKHRSFATTIAAIQAQSSYGRRGKLQDVCVVARHCGGQRYSQIFRLGNAPEIPVDAKHLHLRGFARLQ